MKSQVLGPDKGETRELTILNRVIRWTDQGLSWEPDARHAEAIIRDIEIFDGKGVCSPGVKDPEKRQSKESRAKDNGQDAGCVDCVLRPLDSPELPRYGSGKGILSDPYGMSSYSVHPT